MKIWLIPAASIMALTMASSAFAQMKEFTGASVYGLTGYSTWSTEWSDAKSGTASLSVDASNSAGLPLFVGLDYTWAVDSVNSLGVAFERNFLKSAAGASNFSTSNGYGGGFSTTVDSSYQLSVLPGFLIDKDSLVYGKFGYYSADLTIVGSNSTYHVTQNGYSLGAGIKTLFHNPNYGNNFYIFGESNYRIGNSLGQTFDSSSANIKLGGLNLLVGVGMNF
jgi:hypothetical protein